MVNTALDENDGDRNDGDCSLRDAIQTANAGETITFNADFTIYLSSTLALTKELTIDGTGRSITISGDTGNDGSRDVRVFNISASGVVTLSYITVVSGTATRGGGISNEGTLLVSNSAISDNVATGGGSLGGGGGIYAFYPLQFPLPGGGCAKSPLARGIEGGRLLLRQRADITELNIQLS